MNVKVLTSLESVCLLIIPNVSSMACRLASMTALSTLLCVCPTASLAFSSAALTAFCSSTTACRFTSLTASSARRLTSETLSSVCLIVFETSSSVAVRRKSYFSLHWHVNIAQTMDKMNQ